MDDAGDRGVPRRDAEHGAPRRDRLLSTFRKIYVDKSILESTIDAYLSEDGENVAIP